MRDSRIHTVRGGRHDGWVCDVLCLRYLAAWRPLTLTRRLGPRHFALQLPLLPSALRARGFETIALSVAVFDTDGLSDGNSDQNFLLNLNAVFAATIGKKYLTNDKIFTSNTSLKALRDVFIYDLNLRFQHIKTSCHES